MTHTQGARTDVAAQGRTLTVAETAARVVHEYLGVATGERFTIVVDARTDPEIPAELFRAARAAGAEPVVVTFAARAMSGAEPPEPAAVAMAAADVVICAASTSLYHTAAKAGAQRAGARGDFNAPWRAEAWRNGAMTADFVAIRAQAESLADLMRPTQTIRVTSTAGTDLTARIAGREPKAWLTGICRLPGEVSALPGGEVSLPPVEGTTNGVVVWERVASDLRALDRPVTITIRDGRAVDIQGGASAARLREIVERVRDADNVAEIGIGLNPEARIADEITEAKKALGTVHVALGDSANEYGGTVECEVHLDGLVLDPTVTFDGVAVIVDGRHLYEVAR
ncbi:MAG TPA: aminopeptidase [Candidatus Limnocylindria bacterium]|nr:aminopeptidase [Candidatus Limnocylindria bacterium]